MTTSPLVFLEENLWGQLHQFLTRNAMLFHVAAWSSGKVVGLDQ